MTGWAVKRFWKDATVSETDTGFRIALDGRGIKTPAKVDLEVPTNALAEQIADEWRAVEEQLDPNTMPFTRSANAAIDKVMPQFDEVASLLGDYCETDALCYRADSPAELTQRQAVEWDPILDWLAESYGARLRVCEGVMPIAQDADATRKLRAVVMEKTPFELVALHDLISLTGSFALGLAIADARLSPEEGWRLSRIDEDWQIEQWGADEEAESQADIKRLALHHATKFYQMAQG